MEKDLYRGRREDPRPGPRAPDKTGTPITPGKMKASALDLLNKSFKEAKEKQEYDYEGDMAMSQLKSIIANAQRIHDMLERDTNIPEWVQSKITLAEDYISTAANYMQGEMKEETAHSVHVKTYDSHGEKQMNSPEFKKHVSAHGGELDYPSDKGAAFKFKSASHAAAFHRGVQSKFRELDSEHDMHEDMAMGTGPVNVAANVADPKNKRLFGKPAKRTVPSFKSFVKK